MAEVTAGSRSVELEQQVRQLSTALAGNRLTATAVGLVMADRRVDRAAASAWLVAESQRTAVGTHVGADQIGPPTHQRGCHVGRGSAQVAHHSVEARTHA